MRGFQVFLAFELSEGCSGSCHFCCFDTKKLQSYYQANSENLQLFTAILKVCQSIFGQSAERSILYYRTEPFDNPDYEKYIEQFIKVFKTVPQTTSVMGIRQFKRLKQFSQSILSQKDLKENKLRLSIVNIEQFERLMSKLTAVETENIEFVFNNPESKFQLSESGRARQMAKENLQKQLVSIPCSCDNGFLVNFCTRQIQLIVSQTPSDKYPDGYQSLVTKTFRNAHDFSEKIQEIISYKMPIQLTHKHRVVLANGVEVRYEKQILTVLGDDCYRKMSVVFLNYCLLQELDGSKNFDQIFQEHLLTEIEISRALTFFNQLYSFGYLIVI
jgi:hypothetical protein